MNYPTYEDVPTPTFADPDATLRVPTHEDPGEADPRYLAEYLRTWGLRLLYWQVGDEMAGKQILSVIYSNGKADYLANVQLDPQDAYDLFSPDETVDEITLQSIAVGLIENRQLADLGEHPGNAWNSSGYSSVGFTDRELVRAAVNYFEEPIASLLSDIATMMRDLPLGLSVLDPRQRIANRATEIAFEVL